MALHLLARSMGQLSLRCASLQPKVSATSTSFLSQYQGQPLLSALLSSNRCGLHTSAAVSRNLDSHAHPPWKLPTKRKRRWVPRQRFVDMYDYTIKPLPFPKTGGRGPNGRIWTHRIGGGHKRNFRMIDWVRGGPTEGKPMVEKVEKIVYDPNRSGRLALVATGERKRYIMATQNMKAGDLINSSRVLSKTAVRAGEGDSYPLGSLPIGTLVNCVELYPSEGALRARAAGVTATVVRKLDDKVIVRLPSKREICVANTCVATVGRVSNVDHNKRVIGKAGRNRWLGIRPKSGRWHRKDGRFGRKIKPIKRMQVYDKPRTAKAPVYQLSTL